MALVMFDLDGTLLDTASEIADSVNRTLHDFGKPAVSLEEVRDWIGYGTGWLMRQAWTKSAGEPDEAIWPKVMERFIAHYYDCAGSSSVPFPHVMATLDRLKELRVKCAVVTNKETRFTDRILAKHGMQDSFDMVICGDTLSVKKPSPAVIEHCLHTLSESAGESLFVGDSEIDVATARAAGVTCWAVPYGYNMGSPITAAAPDRVVDTIEPVPNFFKGLA